VRNLRVVATVVAMGVNASLAGAQTSIGMSREQGVAASAKIAQQSMEDFAECTIKTKARRELAAKLIRTFPQDHSYVKGLDRLAENDCVPSGLGSMAFKSDILRLALFTAFYRRDFGENSIAVVNGYKPLNAEAEFKFGSGTTPEIFLKVRAIADCAVRAKPGQVHRLLVAKVRSLEEGQLWSPLVAELARCNQSGIEFRMQKVTLRGTLAEALYKVRTIYVPQSEVQKAPDA
jgi:hypothetical protein